MKINLLKAALPLVMLGSPALAASSIRSSSRWRVKKAVTQSAEKITTIEESQPSFENPFGGFGEIQSSFEASSSENTNVLSFLAEEGFLHASSEAKSIISGNEMVSFAGSRKEFLDTTIVCVAGATYNGKNLSSVGTSSYSGTTYFTLSYSASVVFSVPQNVFLNALAACRTPPAPAPPTSIPTLSQWVQYLLMLVLALIGMKAHGLRKAKVKN